MGFWLFPVIYLLAGVVGALAQYLLSPASNIPMLGASGAVAGILGSYFVFFPRHRIKSLIPILGFFTIIEIPASIMLFYWFITQIFSGAITTLALRADIGGVAYFAHIGGFMSGWIISRLLK